MPNLRPSIDDFIIGGNSWEHQFIKYFQESYDDIKEKLDKYKLLSLERSRLKTEFIDYYNVNYKSLENKLVLPDRHKVIASLTRAFLDAAPFECNFEKAKVLIEHGKRDFLRIVVFPNEVFAIDICKTILNQHGIIVKSEKYDFKFPDNVYLYTPEPIKSNYEYELYLLYRHYINTKRTSKGQFSLYQMASLYFTLEMSYDIGKLGDGSKYYT